ncbi:hypothetical protein D9M70_580450 [compost metagenome]
MDTDVLVADLFNLFVEFDGVALKPGHVHVAVQRVEARGGVPGGAGGEHFPLQQHDVAPAEFGQVVKHGASNDATTDHDDLSLIFHDIALNIPMDHETGVDPWGHSPVRLVSSNVRATSMFD